MVSGLISVAGHTFDFIGLDSQGGFFLLEFLRLGVKSLSESGILEKSGEFTGILHQTAHTLYIVRFKLRGFFQVSFLDRIEKSGDRGFGGFFVHRLAACQDQAAQNQTCESFHILCSFCFIIGTTAGYRAVSRFHACRQIIPEDPPGSLHYD